MGGGRSKGGEKLEERMRKESQMERNQSLSTHGSFLKIRFLSILSVYDVIQAATLGDIQIEGQATFHPQSLFGSLHGFGTTQYHISHSM